MISRILIWLGSLAVVVAAMPVHAATYGGNFGDPANTALVGSDLGSASFTDADAVANNVALYNLIVPTSEIVSITSTSFGTGGIDPYLSLFQGTGGSATFLDSNYNQAFSTGGDLDYSALLSKGSYEVALGVFANLSFAENYGSGTLADGFTGLGDPGSLGDGSYKIQVTMNPGTPPIWTPEIDPSTAASGLTILFGLLLVMRGRVSIGARP